MTTMKLKDINRVKPCAVAVGTFDGMHPGHRRVLDTLLEKAREKNLDPVAVTFNRHPMDVIYPDRSPMMLALPQTRKEEIEKRGVETYILDFDEETAAITSREWMRHMHDDAGMRLLVVGYDNTFGSDGVNKSVADFSRIGAELGVEVVEAPRVNGISSTAIRKALEEGEVEKANDLLGHPFTLEGPVVHGRGLGRKLGFPTANIVPDPRLAIPRPGVYAAMSILPGGEAYPACVNIGSRPTTGYNSNPSIEAHVFDIDRSLYGLVVKLEFHKRLRDEKKFNSFDSLSNAIKQDAHETLRYLIDKGLLTPKDEDEE